MSEIKNITTINELQTIINDNTTVVADFWAEWCGPCRVYSPLVDRLADENESVTVVKVNVDEAPELAQAFQVQSIPTIIAWNGDIEKGRGMIGVRPYETLQAFASSAE